MNRHRWLGAVGFALTLAGAANAKETGVEIGVRSGYALPLGDARGGEKLSDGVSGIIPLWFDLGYRLTPNVMIGAYARRKLRPGAVRRAVGCQVCVV